MATSVAMAQMRTWTFEESKATMRAEVLGFTGDAVTLRREDGGTVSVRIPYLIESDRAYLAGQRATQWKEVEVVKLLGEESTGMYKKCMVRGKDVQGEILIENLPPAVKAILDKRSQEDAQITNLSAQVNSQSRAVKQAKAAIPAGTSVNRAYRRALAAERAQVARASRDLKTAQANLAKLQKSYDDSVRKTKDQTLVKMRNTGVVYKGLPVWECGGLRKPPA